VYASWNGATTVASWRIRARGRVVATAPRSGFETAIRVASAAPAFEVEALDAGGRVLGTSRPFAVSR
jgi:hypothetical protein